MFENLTYKQKFLVIIAISVLLGFTAYKRSFKLTIDAYNEYYELSEQLFEINSSSSTVQELDIEIRFLDNLLGEENMESVLVQQEILNFVTNKSKSVNVFDVAEVHEASDNKFIIHTNQLTIEGSFEELLKIVYQFEKEFPYSRVVNTSFFKKKDFKTRRIKLYAKIIFQNYEKNI
ncbi:MAG: hypothetical protein HRT69_12030 [Flavobacteriaceae bacterium]|nr:hypothetical protein [Flavobacteriaceae bacterium]